MTLLDRLIAVSIYVNECTGGPKGWSLCASFYAGKREGIAPCAALVWGADTLFFFDPDHCRKAWLLRMKESR